MFHSFWFLEFRVHVVVNLIPTLIGSVAAWEGLANVEHDKQFERHALDEMARIRERIFYCKQGSASCMMREPGRARNKASVVVLIAIVRRS